jgi:uncharacterized RmlC-like cupin family protein
MQLQVVKPGPAHGTSRGVIGGAEISQATVGANNIFMGVFRVPPSTQSRPHYHANCESTLYMLSGTMLIRHGDNLDQELHVVPGDLLYVPPNATHVVENRSETETIEYVVARNSPTEDSVEVPWAGNDPGIGYS